MDFDAQAEAIRVATDNLINGLNCLQRVFDLDEFALRSWDVKDARLGMMAPAMTTVLASLEQIGRRLENLEKHCGLQG